MLVLTRSVNQKIFLQDKDRNDQITVTVLDIDRNRVRIGIDAPRDYSIERDNAIKTD